MTIVPGPRDALLALVLVVLVPASIPAQSTPWARQAEDRMDRAIPTVSGDERAEVRLSTGGLLNQDESASVPVVLLVGVSYAIVGTCDNDCDRLGLVLARAGYDLTGERGSSLPVLRYTPRTTSRFDVTVRMLACLVSPCTYRVTVVQLP